MVAIRNVIKAGVLALALSPAISYAQSSAAAAPAASDAGTPAPSAAPARRVAPPPPAQSSRSGSPPPRHRVAPDLPDEPTPRRVVFADQVCDLVNDCDLSAPIADGIRDYFNAHRPRSPTRVERMWGFLDLDPNTNLPRDLPAGISGVDNLLDVIDYRISDASFLYTGADRDARRRIEDIRTSLLSMTNGFVLRSDFLLYVNQNNGRNTEQDRRLGELERRINRPVAAAARGSEVPRVIRRALERDERRVAQAASGLICNEYETLKNDTSLEDNMRRDITARPADTQLIIARYNTYKTGRSARLAELAEQCDDAKKGETVVAVEYEERVRKNLVGADSMSVGVFGGYQQAWVGGLFVDWKPFADMRDSSMYLRHIGLGVEGYGMTGSEASRQKRVLDSGNEWNSVTRERVGMRLIAGARVSASVPLVADARENVVLSLAGGVGATGRKEVREASTVTTVEGAGSRPVRATPENRFEVEGYGFGGLRLDLPAGLRFEGGISETGATERLPVTPYGTLGWGYRF